MVHFVGAGCGAKDLITVRGAKYLEEADVIIYAGSLVNEELLTYNKKNAKVYNSAYMTLEEAIEIIKESEKEEKVTVRLHTGEPSIYGAVKEQYDALTELNIPFDITPGVTACFGAAAMLSMEYTLPEISQTLIITRAEGKTSVPVLEEISLLASHKASMAIYLSTALADKVKAALLKGGYEKETPAAVCYKVSHPEEKAFLCTVDTIDSCIKENKINKTAVILVGEAVKPSAYKLSRLYAPDFSTEFRQAKIKE